MRKAEAFKTGLSFGLLFREQVIPPAIQTVRDFLRSIAATGNPVDSGTLNNEVMALLFFALNYGMVSGANDPSVNGSIRDGFFKGFHPTYAEQTICEDRIVEYLSALKQERETDDLGKGQIKIGERQIHAIGAVFAKYIGYEDHALVIFQAASMYTHWFDAGFNQTSH